MLYIPSFADFDYSFILFGAWFQLIGALASAAAGAYGASKSDDSHNQVFVPLHQHQ
jgi:hypothetical protein